MTNTKQQTERRRIRFSMRTLLIVVAVVCVASVVIMRPVYKVMRHRVLRPKLIDRFWLTLSDTTYWGVSNKKRTGGSRSFFVAVSA